MSRDLVALERDRLRLLLEEAFGLLRPEYSGVQLGIAGEVRDLLQNGLNATPLDSPEGTAGGQAFEDARRAARTPPPFDYELLGKAIGRVVNTKQAAYGDSFGKCGAVMAILYPEGIPPEKLGDALAVVRVLDKLFRIATDRDALGEDPWRDVAGYALLSAARVEAKR